jgi:putative SOS response-associated peptidase YedK
VCGRYVHPDEAAIERAWHVGRHGANPFGRRYNVAPTMSVPILRLDADSGELELAAARWSFVPHWWKEAKLPTMTFNARSEEAAVKPMWRYAYAHGRAHCLVVAESWYEWQARERVDPATGEIRAFKQPFNIHRPDGRPFAFAGLVSEWRGLDSAEPVLTCAILTRAAAGPAAEVHDRMPVVLADELCLPWLDARLGDAAATAAIVARSQDAFVYHPVSTRVNSARHDGPELIEPIAREA